MSKVDNIPWIQDIRYRFRPLWRYNNVRFWRHAIRFVLGLPRGDYGEY